MKILRYFISILCIIFIDSVAMESDVKVVPKVPLAVLQIIAKGSINQNGGTEKEIFAATDKMVMLKGNSFRAVMNLVKLYAKQNNKPDNYNYGQFKADIMDYILRERWHAASRKGFLIDLAEQLKAHNWAKFYLSKRELYDALINAIDKDDIDKVIWTMGLGADPNFTPDKSDLDLSAFFLSARQVYRKIYQGYFDISNCSKVFKFLLENGADPLLKLNFINSIMTTESMFINAPYDYIVSAIKRREATIVGSNSNLIHLKRQNLKDLEEIKKMMDEAIEKQNLDNQKSEPSAKEGKQEQD